MICRIRGILETVSENRVELRCGDLVYEVLIPSYLENLLRPRRGETVDFFIKHYLEGGPAISALIPRLVGFQSEAEELIRRARKRHPELDSAEAIVQTVLKELGRGVAR